MKILSLLLIGSLACAAELPSGESLLDLSLERSGGAAAFAKVKTAVMTGTVEMVDHNLSGPVVIYQSGGKSYTAIEFQGIGKVEEGFDGETAWEMSALQGARIKEGAERAAVKRLAKMSMLGSWHEFYSQARTVGTEQVEGKPAWDVEMTPTEGKPEHFYFDKDSALLVQVAMTLSTPLGEIPVEMTMLDYRDIDGIKTPFKMNQKVMSQVLAMHFDKVTYNAEIPPDRFDLPAEIKALAGKQK